MRISGFLKTNKKSFALVTSFFIVCLFLLIQTSQLHPNPADSFVLKKGEIVCGSTETDLFLAGIMQNRMEKRTGLEYMTKPVHEPKNEKLKDQVILCTGNSEYAANVAEKYNKLDIFQRENKAEGFKIIFCSAKDNVLIIQGTDERGLLYGIGRFLHSIRKSDDKYIINSKDVIDYPKSNIRVAWLATNMNNSLSTLSVESYEDLLLEYALWGANHVMTFYGPHFGDPLDPGTPNYERELWLKLPTIFSMAHKYFYSTIYHIHHNYIFPGEGRWSKGSVENYDAIAAEDFGGGTTDHRVCLSGEGMELAYQKYTWILTELKDEIDIVNVHCLDPGGCGCDLCRPFAKTYYHVAKKYAQIWKQIKPDGKVMVDQWWLSENPYYRFQEGSTDASIFVKELRKEMPDWLTATMFDNMSVSKDIPNQYMKTCLMYTCRSPYGALGYQDNSYNSLNNKYTTYLENDVRDGVMIYTEGIQNNLALIINLGFAWDQNASVMQNTIRDYARYYLGDENLDQKTRYITQLNELIAGKSNYYAYFRRGDVKKLSDNDFVNVFINDIRKVCELGDSLDQEYRDAAFNWRWALFYYTGQLWNDIGRLVTVQVDLRKLLNMKSVSQTEKQNLIKSWEAAGDRFYGDMKMIRQNIYEMPDPLTARAFVKGKLSDNFPILKVLLDKDGLQSVLDGLPE